LSSAFCKPSTVCKTNDMVSGHVTCSNASSDTKKGLDNKNIFTIMILPILPILLSTHLKASEPLKNLV
jgi:hypothetical protein